MKKRLLSIFLSGILAIGLCTPALADYYEESYAVSDDSEQEILIEYDEIEEEEEEPEIESDTEYVVEDDEEEVVVSDDEEILVEDIEYYSEEYVITGFTKYATDANTVRVNAYNRPSLEKLVASFPKQIEATLEKRNITTVSNISGELADPQTIGDDVTEAVTYKQKIDVTWYCVGDDYEAENGYYYQFSPKWDEEKYILAEGLDVISDAPYISVVVDFEYGIADENGASNGAFSVSDNRNAVYNYLVGTMKMSSAAACGVMANIQYESGFNPTVFGDGGTSYGLCQWHNDRFTRLKNYCSDRGYDYKSVDGQMHYLEYELKNYYKSVYNYLMNVSDSSSGAYDAAYYWCVYFEVPANRYTVGVTRGNYARDMVWPVYGKQSPRITPTPKPTPTPTPTVTKYKITYKLNGGKNNVSNPTLYTKNTSTITLKNPTKKGYFFKGWYTDPDYTERILRIEKGSKGNVTLYAKWKAKTYNIKFYDNGADLASPTMKNMSNLKYGKKYSLYDNRYTRKGYLFICWNTKADGSGDSFSDGEDIKSLCSKDKGTVKLYAQWFMKTYTVQFYGNGSTGGSMTGLKNVPCYRPIRLTKNSFVKKGYKFVGWNTKADGSGKSYTDWQRGTFSNTHGAKIRLFAQWEKL